MEPENLSQTQIIWLLPGKLFRWKPDMLLPLEI